MAEIMEKMGWQRHTVRGFMAGAMKKAGYTVESFKREGESALIVSISNSKPLIFLARPALAAAGFIA